MQILVPPPFCIRIIAKRSRRGQHQHIGSGGGGGGGNNCPRMSYTSANRFEQSEREGKISQAHLGPCQKGECKQPQVSWLFARRLHWLAWELVWGLAKSPPATPSRSLLVKIHENSFQQVHVPSSLSQYTQPLYEPGTNRIDGWMGEVEKFQYFSQSLLTFLLQFFFLPC